MQIDYPDSPSSSATLHAAGPGSAEVGCEGIERIAPIHAAACHGRLEPGTYLVVVRGDRGTPAATLRVSASEPTASDPPEAETCEEAVPVEVDVPGSTELRVPLGGAIDRFVYDRARACWSLGVWRSLSLPRGRWLAEVWASEGAELFGGGCERLLARATREDFVPFPPRFSAILHGGDYQLDLTQHVDDLLECGSPPEAWARIRIREAPEAPPGEACSDAPLLQLDRGAVRVETLPGLPASYDLAPNACSPAPNRGRQDVFRRLRLEEAARVRLRYDDPFASLALYGGCSATSALVCDAGGAWQSERAPELDVELIPGTYWLRIEGLALDEELTIWTLP